MALDPITAVSNTIGSIIDKIWPDKTEAEKAKVKMAELTHAGQLKELELLAGQLAINQVEAAHASIFVAGWRPFVGWVCGFGLAWQYVVGPFALFFLGVFKVEATLPVIDLGELMTLLLGMLGLAGYRTYETIKDKARKTL
uniref:Putative holin n=1 Tax=viral metagenome TaxID=1070528 RepID=A0A6M3JNK0_9ZZZZ